MGLLSPPLQLEPLSLIVGTQVTTKGAGTHLDIVFGIISVLLGIYVYVLLARVVLDLVQVFSRDWRPTGFLLVLAEIVYTLTDPPVRMLRKIIPPLRLGQVSLDLGFIVLLIGVQILSGVFRSLALAS